MHFAARRIIYGIALTLLVVLAFTLRAAFINDIPGGVYPDEAVNGTDAIAARESGDYKWFYTNNNGREGLYLNLIALSTGVFGATIFGLKLWSILAGTLTVLGVYLLTLELFSGRRTAFIAAYLTAVSFWAINFSRIGFRAILVPLILTFFLYFLFRGIRTKKFLPFVASGFIFGLGFHTYIAYRIAPALLLVIFIFLLFSARHAVRDYWKHILLFCVAAFVAVAPMLLTFSAHPEYLSSRSGDISVFSPAWNHGEPLQTIAKTTALSLGKYFVWGDQNWRHNFPPYPILDTLSSIAFAVGLIGGIVIFFRVLWRRVHGERTKKLLVFATLLAWFVLFLAPEFLTAEGIPHSLRAIGTLPVVFILAGFAISRLWRRADRSRHKTIYASLLILALLFIGICNTARYFGVWGPSPESRGAFNAHYTAAARWLNSLPPSVNRYVVPNGEGQTMEDGLPVSAHTIGYLTHDSQRVEFLNTNSTVQFPAVIVFMRRDDALAQKILDRIPDARVETIGAPNAPEAFTAVLILPE